VCAITPHTVVVAFAAMPLSIRLLLFIAGVLWGVQFLVLRDGWVRWFVRHSNPGQERFWRISPFVFAGMSFAWALVMLSGFLFA
jgi:hypothetical protein